VGGRARGTPNIGRGRVIDRDWDLRERRPTRAKINAMKIKHKTKINIEGGRTVD
jgi:hypothetical protein